MSSPRTCLNCGRTMFTPSGFCPPSPGSLMVSTLSQCTECHDKGLPDLDPPRPLGVGKDGPERVVSIPCTRVTVGSYPVPTGPIRTLPMMADEAQASYDRGEDHSAIRCTFCEAFLPRWPGRRCKCGKSASFLVQSNERHRKRMLDATLDGASQLDAVTMSRLLSFSSSLPPVCPECHEHNKYGVEEHNGYKVYVACSHPFHRLRKGRK